ncbi:MAG: hypothetical protein LAT82_04985 [Nanoarchaeota archaeon]|nr:hypothetical protein [Nanoarchaeota archaeon]
MVYKFGSIIVLLVIMTSLLFASGGGSTEDQLFTCEFISTSQIGSQCSGNMNAVAYYAAGDLTGDGELINAKISSTQQTGYNHALCCTSGHNVSIDFNVRESSVCSSGEYNFGFLSSLTNAKLSLERNSNYPHSICLDADESTGSLDIRIENLNSPDANDWELVGYTCMYRFSNANPNLYTVTSKVSSCDARFGSNQQYPFLVYARLTPNIETTTCNPDCTSRFDGRIYEACASQLASCSFVPEQCDGSLSGQWVRYDQDREILCQSPFNQFRASQLSDEQVQVSSIDETSCRDILVEKYTVLINREPVTMNVYICND